MHNALDVFDTVVHTRHRQACNGLRWMLGYTTKLSQWVYHNCMAGAELSRAMLVLGDTFFVDMMLYRCLCVTASGQDYAAYVVANCAAYIPPTRKAQWQATMAAAAGGQTT